MRPETYKLFAQFCESFLPEASSSMSMITGNPGGKEVVQKLHREMGLSHDQAYKPIPKISWSDLKGNWRGAWVIIQGTKGTGAIKASGGSTSTYHAVASVGGEVNSFQDQRGGNVLDFLTGNIGKLQKFYVGNNDTRVNDKKKQRAELNKVTGPQAVNQTTLINKFKPLWVKAIVAAIADSKGHVANMIKNDAFSKAQTKLNHIEQLQNGLDAIEAGNTDTPEFIGKAVNTAVLMAAHHHYPEETGDITRSYGRSYSSQFHEGPQKLLQDISQGDTSKLGTILAFFKRALISG